MSKNVEKFQLLTQWWVWNDCGLWIFPLDGQTGFFYFKSRVYVDTGGGGKYDDYLLEIGYVRQQPPSSMKLLLVDSIPKQELF